MRKKWRKEEGKNETERKREMASRLASLGGTKCERGKAQGGRGWENKGEKQTLGLEKELK